ncbi:Ctf18p Ecym_2429 [Eremothecium cymbalariae DBVPG|uniref:AAA+ ATPase domain-containing protein n=1 Tax=Eremothecium cymbalariae (strain CBS 270.75 / DBVPG 7215 / KCTC 17166 / NRRL Y-17582) TaxID=931890 RepID=G8JPA1_ERECY|nr:Hypothetical protein Ecym_2429 [Eremothecium cymbalariae DBVPG\
MHGSDVYIDCGMVGTKELRPVDPGDNECTQVDNDVELLPEMNLAKNFKGSILFSGEDGKDDGNADASKVSNGTGVRAGSFISCDGRVVVLRKKAETVAPQVQWSSEESYGININQLLDRLEVKGAECAFADTNVNGANLVSCEKVLWAEKWRPSKFLDLVGNEKNNRRVMRWLQQWAPVVFGEVPKKDPSLNRQQLRGGQEDQVIQEQEYDPFHRPDKKILLIHGPPGIGKTSVAHVVAKQAGYVVMEINASDERAGTKVKEKVHNCLFNESFNDKPVLLLADEIDGSIENGFVRVLLDIIRHDSRATRELILKHSQLNRKHRRTKYSGKILTRPIIAVCNNIYTNALEELRQHCQIVAFRPPGDAAIIERLEYVCKKERVRMDRSLVKQVVESSQGDVRNSLNNLQFLSVTENKDGDINSRQKDIGVSWFKICNQLFKKDLHKDIKTQFQDLLCQVEVSASYDKIIEGCFQLFPQVRYSDTGLTKPSQISDWLFFSDRMAKSLYEFNGELMRYCPATAMTFFQLFSDVMNKQDLRIKSMDFEVRESKRANRSIASSILYGIPAISRSFVSVNSLILEILPHLDYILTPDFNKIHEPSLKQRILENVIPLLKQFNLQIQPTEDSEYKSILCITPCFDAITTLDSKRAKDISSKRIAILNILIVKLEEIKAKKRSVQSVKRAEEDHELRRKTAKLTTVDFFKDQYKSIGSSDSVQPEPISTTTANSSRLRFPFGKSTNNKGTTATDDPNITNAPLKIWVKYKEGFSDAVRKNVNWSTLWQ